jgi:hypothetical protein
MRDKQIQELTTNHVVVVDLRTGEVLADYTSVTEARDALIGGRV